MNSFAYFTDIEERFQRRRGSLLMLSTLDWALIETWREAGVPLEAVLRGMDDAFDKHDAKTARGLRVRKVNGLAWCAQAVMQATEDLREASIGIHKDSVKTPRESGFEAERVAAFLEGNAGLIQAAMRTSAPGAPSSASGNDSAPKAKVGLPDAPHLSSEMWASTTSRRLLELATQMRSASPLPLDDLDRTLTVLEEKMVAALMQAVPEVELVALREQADRELAPYRARMQAVQLRQVQQQFLLKKLLESRRLPRLSLFYMGHA